MQELGDKVQRIVFKVHEFSNKSIVSKYWISWGAEEIELWAQNVIKIAIIKERKNGAKIIS